MRSFCHLDSNFLRNRLHMVYVRQLIQSGKRLITASFVVVVEPFVYFRVLLNVTIITKPPGAVGHGLLGSGGRGPPDFVRSVNPIQTRGVDYSYHSTICPLDFQTFLRPCCSQVMDFPSIFVSSYCIQGRI